MKVITFSRRELYDLVWSEPLVMLAQKYDISGTGLRRICRNLGVPAPQPGYWLKLKAGKDVAVWPLPEVHHGEQEVKLVLINPEKGFVDHQGKSPLEVMQSNIERELAEELKVPHRLIDPDPLILKAKKSFEFRSGHTNENEFGSTEKGESDIRVSRKLFNRALCIMDTFIRIMRLKGHDFEMWHGESHLRIGGTTMKITLREGSNSDVVNNGHWDQTIYHPNGILTLKLEHYSKSTSIKDGKILLENQLSKLIAKLELMGAVFKAEHEERLARQKIVDEKRKLEEDRIYRKKVELDSFKQILEDSRRWKEVVLLREYIDHIEEEAMRNGRLTDDITAWLNWARKKADWFDPLLEVDDESLKGIDPNSLLAHHHEQPKSTSYGSSYSGNEQAKSYWPGMPWYLKK